MTTITQEKQHNQLQTSSMVGELIEERQQVWSMYCKVADHKNFADDKELPKLINEFCQILIDYISLGHFGVYQHIADDVEQRSDVIKIAESVYHKIVDTTEAALVFNDKYVQNCIEVSMANLKRDLSILGEKLALRIDAEDKICDMILH